MARNRRPFSPPDPATQPQPIIRNRRTEAAAVHESEEKALDERIRKIAREEIQKHMDNYPHKDGL